MITRPTRTQALVTAVIALATGSQQTPAHEHSHATGSISPAWQSVIEAPGLSAEQRAGARFAARHVHFDEFQQLPPEHRSRLIRYAADHRDGSPSLVLCWHSGTPAAIVQAFHAIEEAARHVRRPRGPEPGIGTALQVDPADHWSTTASGGGSQGTQGLPVTLTWSLVPEGTIIPGGEVDGEGTNDPSNLRAWLAGLYGGSSTGPAASQPWFPIFQAVFDDIAAETGVRYVYEPNDDGAQLSSLSGGRGVLGVRGDVRISGHALDGDSNVLAYNYFPDYGDMVIDTSDAFFNNLSNNSQRLYNVVAHEHGHGLGLQHVCPVDNTKLMEPFINLSFTGFQFDDIYSAQRLYGDFHEVHGSERNNDSFSTATPLTPGVGVPMVAEWLGIDDNTDSDHFRFEVPAGTQLTVRVAPSALQYLEGEQNQITGDCTAGTLFDSSTLHDLAFEVLAPDQTTVLATANSQPAGVAEEVADLAINTAGSYYLRVTGGAADFNQLYRLELLVDAPSIAIRVASTTILTELFQGQNGAPDPGETIRLGVSLEHVGLVDASNLSGTLAGPAALQGFDTSHDFGNVASGGQAAGEFTFALNGACGESVDLQLDLTADGGYAATIPVSLTLGSEVALLAESFDAGPSLPTGWGNDETGRGSLWSVVTNASASAPNAVFAENRAQAGQSILTSPPIAIGAGAGTLSFSHLYDTEAGWDGGVLEIQIGGGAWQDILAAGGSFASGAYNDVLGSGNNPLENRSAWSGSSGTFITTTVDMPAATAGQTVQFRWILGHDQRIAGNGWFIDDVVVTDFTCDSSGPALLLSCTETTLAELPGASAPAELSVAAALPVPADIPITLTTSGTADPANDLSGFGNLTLSAGNSVTSTSLTAVSDGLVEGDETLEITSPDATGTVQLTLTDTPYGQWAAANLGTTGAVNPGDDFDSDGSTNVEELIFGSNGADASSEPSYSLVPQGTDYKIFVPLGSLPGGISVTAEASDDLQLWSDTGITVLGDGFLIAGGDTRFVRLRYVVNP